MNDISMVLCSCDNYDDAWIPFCKQLVKNWPGFDMPIYLGTESKSFSFEGLDIRCPLAGGKIYRNWSERLIKLLDSIDTEYILFMLDDFWLSKPVDVDAFNKIFGYMKTDRSMGFVCLRNENQGGKKTAVPIEKRRIPSRYPELVRCLSKEPFRITTQVGIWRRNYFLKLLRRHESAWYFETRATWRSKFYREKIYDVLDTVITYPVGGFFGGGKCYEDYMPLYDSDITQKCVEKRGLTHFGDKRDYPGIHRGIGYYYSIFLSVLPKW